MTSSLQKGINAAKAGRMQEALDFMKDAIIEEPQNADVWVWIAAIIDDLDKQEIFLKKALEIDPNNIPAQRGLAYLQKRKRDNRDLQGDHLSDHTRPISRFPSSKQQKTAEKEAGWSKLNVDELNGLANTEEEPAQEGFFQNLPKLNTIEIILLGVVVLVFCFIGLLAASAIFEFELPLNSLSFNKPTLATEPPYPGVFLYENEIFFDIQAHQGVPTQETGIPTSFEEDPVIVLWQTTANPDQMRLIYETGKYISFQVFQGKSDADLVKPEQSLQTGLYCFQQTPEQEESEVPFYWCFRVAESDSE